MTISDVTSRISQIQSQLAMLGPARSNATGSTDFSAALDASTTASEGTGDGAAVVAEARKYLGIPYVWGGTDPEKGLDCSGLVQHVYRQLGYDLPRVSYQQAAAGRPVASLAQAQPGDLIAWDNSSRNNGVDHIAIYIGNGKMIEAPRPGANVRISDVTTPPDVIRRIVPDDGSSPVGATGGATAGRVPAGAPYADLFNRAAGTRVPVAPPVAPTGTDPASGTIRRITSGGVVTSLIRTSLPGRGASIILLSPT